MDDDNRPLGTAEKYFLVTFTLVIIIAAAVIIGGIVFAVATNLKESALFLAGLAGFALLVHIIVRKVDWDD